MSVQHYTIVPGQLFAGEYPGDMYEQVARERLASLVAEGVTTFIDLTALEDPLEPYEDLLESIAPGLRYFRHPIRDLDIPGDPQEMREILDRIRDEVAAGHACYFHCWGGIGRTGTVAGCWFREQGQDGKTALESVQALYSTMPKSKHGHPYSPQTTAQAAYVREWK